MALIVEDGTGKIDASSYVSVAFVDLYHRERANETWTGAFSAKEAAIRKATEYIDAEWVFQGTPTHPEVPQALQWPRASVFDQDCNLVDQDSLPVALERATAEMALSILVNGGDVIDPIVTGAASKRRERVGVLESETVFDTASGTAAFPRVSLLLAPFIAGTRSSGGSSPLLRG